MTKKEAMAEFQRDGMCDCGEYAIGVIRYINSNGAEIFSPSCGSCNDPILEAEWVQEESSGMSIRSFTVG